MDVHGDLDLMGNNLKNTAFALTSNFPDNPTPGRVCFKDSTLYFCTEMAGGLPVWVPLTQTLQMVQFNVSSPALEWTLMHNLNTNIVFVQTYDASGKWVLPDYIDCSVSGQVTVGFSVATAGIAILQRGNIDGAIPQTIAYNQDFNNLSTWIVTHGLGYNPIVQVIVGGAQVQPLSIVMNSTMQLTVTFSAVQTGEVRCI